MGTKKWLEDFTAAEVTRRSLLQLLPGACIACDATAQSMKPEDIPVRSLNRASLIVSDLQRSFDFYQGLFGTPVQHRRENNGLILKVGAGPQGLELLQRNNSGTASGTPQIARFCLTTTHFSPDAALKRLAHYGVARTDNAELGGPLRSLVKMRMEDEGGAKGGTAELYFTDPDGITIQLQDVSYCGGSGYSGNICRATPASSARKGLFIVRDLNHVSINVSNLDRSLEFYRDLFGMPIQHRQGTTTVSLRIGAGPQGIGLFLGGNGATGGTPGTPNIAHFCLTIESFNPDKVLKKLAEYGVKPRGGAGPGGPLTSLIRMRMEDQGGAKGGTPELYFTDPDGITIQLQDVSYCGGSGYLGNVCG
jgi:catechol 2,3-dioxygenase-like lactoylglutathione lyase family enzyme